MEKMLRYAIVVSLAVLLAPSVMQAQTKVFEGGVHPSWAPGAAQFVCYDGQAVVRVSSAGSVLETIDQSTASQDVGVALFHPDGMRVIYLRRDTSPLGDWEVTIKTIGGGSVAWPAAGLWDDFGISFYAATGEVLYDDTNGQVWALDISDGSTRAFLAGVEASVSPDGQWVVFIDNLTDRNLTVRPIGGGTDVVIGQGSFSIWTEDSSHILFTDSAGDLYIATRNGGGVIPLLTGPDFEIAGSHDSGLLAFSQCPASCDVWTMSLSLVPTDATTWGKLKSKFK